MGNSDYAYTKRNEFGDEFRYKSGTGRNSKWTGTRMCLGKREKRTFTGDNRQALEEWAEWTHECEREAPPEEPTPVVPAQFRTKEEELPTGHATNDEVVAEIEELLEVGDMTQREIAEAYGVAESTVSRIKSRAAERQARHDERQRVREEERRLRAEERDEEAPKRPEPLPDGFKPRPTEAKQPEFYFIAAGEGVTVTLFRDRETAEKVARFMRRTGETFTVSPCEFWEEV